MPPEDRTQARNCGCRRQFGKHIRKNFLYGVIWRSNELPGEVCSPPLTQVLGWINGQRGYECHIDFRWWFKESLCPWKTEVPYSWPSNITGLNYAVTLSWEIFVMINITVMHDPWLDESMDGKPQIQRKRRCRRLSCTLYIFDYVNTVSISNSQIVQKVNYSCFQKNSLTPELWLIESNLSFYFQLENIHKHRYKLNT